MKHALPEKDEEFLIDEIDKILDKIEPTAFMESLSILYKTIKGNNIELLLLFIKGLRENDFFEYTHFIKSLNGRH